MYESVFFSVYFIQINIRQKITVPLLDTKYKQIKNIDPAAIKELIV